MGNATDPQSTPVNDGAAKPGTMTTDFNAGSTKHALGAPIENLIFDLDGTLLDTLPDLVLLTNGILTKLGFPERTQDEILSFVGNGVRSLMIQALPDDAPQDAEDKAMELWNEKFYDYYEHTFPYPGMKETLDSLKERGCKLGVVSNKLQSGVDLIIAKCLPDYFAIMLGESPTCPRKPDPTGIKMAMSAMGATPENTAYIGDSPSDMVAAHNAGLPAIAVLWGYHKKEDFPTEGAGKPDLLIETSQDLLKLVK